MGSLRRIDLFVTKDSDKSVEDVKVYAKGRANDRTDADSNQDDDGNPKELFYYDVTDFKRDGQKYMVFGDAAYDKLSGGDEAKMSQVEEILNMNEIKERVDIIEENAIDNVKAVVID